MGEMVEKSEVSKLKLSDFELVKKIGQGGFGAVYVSRKKDTKEVLALKVVKKSLIWKKNKVTQMKNERDVLASHLTSWMVQLAYSFQDRDNCYLAMEYCPGGDLRHLLSALGYLEEQEARLYMAEMILAVFSLHSLGYTHRDLKPDNFLIDSNGHLKLTDFGLSKDGLNSNVAHRRFGNPMTSTSSLPDLHPSSSRPSSTPQHSHFRSRTHGTSHSSMAPTPLFEGRNLSSFQNFDSSRDSSSVAFSVVGSPHYMSPEVLSETNGYGAEVDWWSLGCIFWELVTGSPPFVGETPQAVFDAILDWKNTLPSIVEENRESMSPECLDFILQFLCETKERFGHKRTLSLSKLFSHPFFKDFTVEKIFDMEPPFVPQLSDECDTTYFEMDDSRISPLSSSSSANDLRDGDGGGNTGNGNGNGNEGGKNLHHHSILQEQINHHHNVLPNHNDDDHHHLLSSGPSLSIMTPPSIHNLSHGLPSMAIQCPQTAPRRLSHHNIGPCLGLGPSSGLPQHHQLQHQLQQQQQQQNHHRPLGLTTMGTILEGDFGGGVNHHQNHGIVSSSSSSSSSSSASSNSISPSSVLASSPTLVSSTSASSITPLHHHSKFKAGTSYDRFGALYTQSRSSRNHQQNLGPEMMAIRERYGAAAGGMGAGNGVNAHQVRFTPLKKKRLPLSPSRDIAGFTFQRKKAIRPSSHSVTAIIRLDFDSEIPLQYYQRSSSPSSDTSSSSSTSNASPSDLGAHFDLYLLDLTPKALVFGEERSE